MQFSSSSWNEKQNDDNDDDEIAKRRQQIQDALSTTSSKTCNSSTQQQQQQHWSKGKYEDDIDTPWDDEDFMYNTNFEDTSFTSSVAKGRQKLQDDDLLFTSGTSRWKRKTYNIDNAFEDEGDDDFLTQADDDYFEVLKDFDNHHSRKTRIDNKKEDDNGISSKADPTIKEVSDESLSPQQREAIRLITETKSNVFITGVAGTGKTLVIQRAIQHLKDTLEDDEWVALAPTGTAAIAMGGQTIHSFAGIGISTHRKECFKNTQRKPKAKQWKKLKTVIIDEISMVSGELWDRLSQIVCKIRNRNDSIPFGGIQLIVCGDFLQLPPIPTRISDVKQILNALAAQGKSMDDSKDLLFLNRGYCFQAKAWQDANFEFVQLEQVFRQKQSSFVNVLQDIRVGQVTPQAERMLLGQCHRPLPPNQYGIKPTILHSKNTNVKMENMQELRKLKGETYTFTATDSVVVEDNAPPWAEKVLEDNQFFKTCLAEKELQLKVGAQVMLIKNEKNGQLVNGSRGKVIGFKEFDFEKNNFEDFKSAQFELSYPIVQFVNGSKRTIKPQEFTSRILGLGSLSRIAIPLRLAWAVTTHKSQGLTLDYVIADLKHVFAEAQAYVALSRVSDENGLELRNFSRHIVKANPIALSFYANPQGSFPHWGDINLPDSNMEHQEKKKQSLETSDKTRLSQLRVENSTQTLSNESLKGKTIVLSGVFRTFTRDVALSMVERLGGTVRQSVSGKTNYLILGSKRKNGKYTTLGKEYGKAVKIMENENNKSCLQILNEEEFIQIVRKSLS